MANYNRGFKIFNNQTTDGISIDPRTNQPYFDLQYDVQEDAIIDYLNNTRGNIDKPNATTFDLKHFFLQISGELDGAKFTLQSFDFEEGQKSNPDYTNDIYWTTTGEGDENALSTFGLNPCNKGNKGLIAKLPTAPLKYRLVLSNAGANTNITAYVVYQK